MNYQLLVDRFIANGWTLEEAEEMAECASICLLSPEEIDSYEAECRDDANRAVAR